MPHLLRTFLVGRPIATEHAEHEKIGLFGGLAVFAADAMSSVAYGPEEVLIILAMAGPGAMGFGVPIGVALAVLIAIVATSYRQTVMEYPSGGGAYVVARENLGVLPAQVAGGALLVDYVLTVAVSVASGVAAITSAWPALFEFRVAIAVGFVLLITMVNLRGVRESAAAFSLPVYGFIVCCVTVIGVGLGRLVSGSLTAAPPQVGGLVQAVPLLLILRAFSSGCASLTGIEAVANGVQAFREPRGATAARVMTLLAVVLATTVIGVSFLAHRLGVTPRPEETVLSQIGTDVFGRGAMYFLLQLTTAFILIFAANTSFADFPRLSAFMARDGYMPRQMSNLHDRLVFGNGIIVLAGLAIVLIVGFQGEVTRLIPLYAVGVFTAFTTSQTGMVVHWVRKKGPAWGLKSSVNGFGAFVTGIVLLVVAYTKFAHGAWLVCLLIPLLVLTFRAIHRHYAYVASRLTLEMASSVHPLKNLNVLLVGGMHRGTLEALQYMKAQGHSARAVHVEAAGESEPRILREWQKWEKEVPLVILQSPYRDLAGPLLEYVAKVKQEEGFDFVTIVVPEFVVGTWWESLLHNHTAVWLGIGLRHATDVAVLNMRYRL